MIVIYNLGGLIVGAAGVLVGLFLVMASGRLSVGLFGLAVVWFALGMLWRRGKTREGRSWAWPAIFFIPLPFVAPVVGALAVPVWFVESSMPAKSRDPRVGQLSAAEAAVRRNQLSGDLRLATPLFDAIRVGKYGSAAPMDVRVYASHDNPGVLVIVQVSNLKDFSNPARTELLRIVAETVGADLKLAAKPLYAGIKGRVLFGATSTPPDRITVNDRHVDKYVLLDAFGPKPVAQPDPSGQPTSPGPAAPPEPVGG